MDVAIRGIAQHAKVTHRVNGIGILNENPMIRKIAYLMLFLIGGVQILLGLVVGRLGIKRHESPFWHELGLSGEHSRVFTKYMGMFQDQWSILTWLGVGTILAMVLLAKSGGGSGKGDF